MNRRRANRLAYLNAKYGPVPDDVPDEEWFARRLASLEGVPGPNLLANGASTMPADLSIPRTLA